MTAKKSWTPAQREMLLRKTRSKIERPRLLEKLAMFLVDEVRVENLLGMEETDALKTREQERQGLTEQCWKYSVWRAHALPPYDDARPFVRQMLARAQALLDTQPCAIWWDDGQTDSDRCGAYQAPRGTCIQPDYDFSVQTAHSWLSIWLYAADSRCVLHLSHAEDGDAGWLRSLECTEKRYEL